MIKYGVMKGGSTAGFFEKSKLPIYELMWEFMSGPQMDQVQVGSNAEGIEKVIEADGKYAYFMESSSIDYLVERECRVTKIGGNLDTKVRNSSLFYIYNSLMPTYDLPPKHLGLWYCYG